MKRIHISSRSQIVATSAAAAVVCIAGAGALHMAAGAGVVANAISSMSATSNDFSKLENELATLRARVATIKAAAKDQAARLEARQAMLAAVVTGKGDAQAIGAMVPTKAAAQSVAAQEVSAMFNTVDARQNELASDLRRTADSEYRKTAAVFAKFGISADRFHGTAMQGVGGPYEPLTPSAPAVVTPKADPQFRALFNSWRQLDQLNKGIVAIPSQKPVDTLTLTSGFGVRSDPFRGGRAMHAGIDIPGAYGAPIYATADGVVGRAGYAGGYGNLVELEHGKGIQTRYGHLASLLVAAGTRVKRGQLIALMGSTGRSTGTHLHYEVRIDGRAVNPMPFLQSSDYLASLQKRSAATALGGPSTAQAAVKTGK